MKRHGLALIVTHPDYLDSDQRIDDYRQFLLKARGTAGIWHALPKHVAHGGGRDKSTLQHDADGVWRVHGPVAARARAAMLRLNDQADAADRIETGALGPINQHPLPSLEWHESTAASGI